MTQEQAELDEREYRKLAKDLVRFMEKAIKDDVAWLMFKVWHQQAMRKGPDRVVMNKDVYPVLWDKYGVQFKKSVLSDRWRDITRLLVKFWETPVDQGGAGMKVPSRLKKKLKVSMGARVAEAVWRERLCRWMLDGVPMRLRGV